MATAETHRTRILVVDDEPLVAGLIAEVLTTDGHEVHTAGNGREALEKIAARSYDLIVSDLRMPELDGVGLFRELERTQPALLRRLVFVSGTMEPAEYASFLEETKAPVLSKPFQVKDLQQLVRQILCQTGGPEPVGHGSRGQQK
jgi:two-component system NtrC family sensor kinase